MVANTSNYFFTYISHICNVIGKIEIKGDIGSYEDEQGNFIKGFDLLDLVSMVKAQRQIGLTNNDPVTGFEVTINSPGGFVNVGFDIYDYLKTIPELVTTIAIGMCASIATIAWFGGSKRIALCPLMIHNPWLGNISGDADKLQEAADSTRATEDMLISFYTKNTGIEKTAIDALMKIETYIPPQEAYDLGFATEAPTAQLKTFTNYKAVARQKDTMSTEAKGLMAEFKKLSDSVMKALKTKVKALMVTEQGGKTLSIMNGDGTEIDGAPDAGDMVTIDGAAAPDGNYIIADLGITITTVGGLITTVIDTDAGSQDSKNLAIANNKIKELEGVIAAQKAEQEADKKALLEVVKDVESFKGVLAKMQGKTDLPDTKNQFRQDFEEKTTEEIHKSSEERRSKYKK